MKRRPDGTCMGQAEFEHGLVIDRCVIALHDFGSRLGATRAVVMGQMKEQGFTTAEISEAAKRMTQ